MNKREAVETLRISNYEIRIFPDSDAENPRDWDDLFTMVCFHGRYDLGDKHNYRHQDYNGWQEMKEAIIKKEKPVIIEPLYLYDHSGITISTSPFSCPWDSGQIGWIFVSKEKLRQSFNLKRLTQKDIDKGKEILQSVIEEYDDYLRGEVYGYEIYRMYTCSEGHEHEEFLDSCWGFFGDYTDCLEEAKSVVELKYMLVHNMCK